MSMAVAYGLAAMAGVEFAILAGFNEALGLVAGVSVLFSAIVGEAIWESRRGGNPDRDVWRDR